MPDASLRADKWLWQARFFKTRSTAAALVAQGGLRINGTPTSKPAHPVRPGDVLTFVQAHQVRVVRIAALGARRGPASEAALLFADLAPLRRDGQATGPAGDSVPGIGSGQGGGS